MAQQGDNTVKMIYDGLTEYISYSEKATYDYIVGIAADRFSIPETFVNSIRLTNGTKYIFTEATFEYYLELFPTPKLSFYIRVDYESFKEPDLGTGPVVININKRHRNIDEYGFPRVTRQNCFIGVYPATELSDEPKAKRRKIGETFDTAMKMLLKSAQSLRI